MLKRDPRNPEANRFFADLHLSRNRCAEAAPFLQRLVASDPQDAGAWAQYGNCLAELSDFAHAGPALQKALDLGVEDEEVFLNRARAYRQEGAKDMAESILSFLLTRNPKNEKASALQAKFKEQDGRMGSGPEE
jgi:predicted Zn-dependent protease